MLNNGMDYGLLISRAIIFGTQFMQTYLKTNEYHKFRFIYSFQNNYHKNLFFLFSVLEMIDNLKNYNYMKMLLKCIYNLFQVLLILKTEGVLFIYIYDK